MSRPSRRGEPPFDAVHMLVPPRPPCERRCKIGRGCLWGQLGAGTADERKHGHGARDAGPMMVRQGGSVSAASALRRWGPLAAVIAALVAGYAFGLHEYLSLESLRRPQDTLLRSEEHTSE